MATKTFRLVFDLTVAKEAEGALATAEEIHDAAEGCCPEAMAEALAEYIDAFGDDDSITFDSIALMSVEEAPRG